MSILWQDVSKEFERDGALRDLYVLETSMEDWQKVVDLIRASASEVRFAIAGKESSLPDSVASVFEVAREAGCLLSFCVGELAFACHFFGSWEIELDFRPTDVCSQTELVELIGFMKRLGELTAKTVIVCHENNPEGTFLRYEPRSNSVVFVPQAPL